MRTQLVVLAMATLVLAAGPFADAAKRCRRLCRDQVQTCVADARARIVCTGLRGAERRACNRQLRTELRTCRSMRGPILSTCKASASVDSCSPSGAFLDGFGQ